LLNTNKRKYRLQKYTFSKILRENFKTVALAFFAASAGRSHLGGLRIVCVGPPYKGKRTISSHYHL
jgi:hypothetical protein